MDSTLYDLDMGRALADLVADEPAPAQVLEACGTRP